MKTLSAPLAPDLPVADFFHIGSQLTDARLDEILPPETVVPQRLHAALRWSVFAGGKRLRPALVLASGLTFGATVNELLTTACALELIHTYSLVHDDLPAMDDDDLRRGRATCHKQFDNATAILAGDALQTLAFQAVAGDENLSAAARVKIIAELAQNAGTPDGMVAGQVFDLAAEGRGSSIAIEELEQIHRAKTGALLTFAVRAGALIANASADELAAVTDYGARLGLLFQITDDLLDVTATSEDLGKTAGKDARAAKATYPAFYGIEEAKAQANAVYENSLAALQQIDRPTALLAAIARFTYERRK